MDRAKFFAAVRTSLFGGALTQNQVNGITAILDTWQASTMTDLRWLTYMLATAFHETAQTMRPVRETRAATDKQAIAILDRSWAKGTMPWVKSAYWRIGADGKSWLGRGYVQLTHKSNYNTLGNAIGVDLVANPVLAMREDIALKVMFIGMSEGLFTGVKLADFFHGTKTDWVNARRIINSTESASVVAGYCKAFHAALVGAA
ncbi:glycoside hydrolase family 19 protein [Agrobacterium vitis]|uniref:glycoside hydrolase family 19 protein n=1 Tax=Agrobacterium vitis TaxID=373 RepID=UPI003D2CCDCA